MLTRWKEGMPVPSNSSHLLVPRPLRGQSSFLLRVPFYVVLKKHVEVCRFSNYLPFVKASVELNFLVIKWHKIRQAWLGTRCRLLCTEPTFYNAGRTGAPPSASAVARGAPEPRGHRRAPGDFAAAAAGWRGL